MTANCLLPLQQRWMAMVVAMGTFLHMANLRKLQLVNLRHLENLRVVQDLDNLVVHLRADLLAAHLEMMGQIWATTLISTASALTGSTASRKASTAPNGP